MRNIKGRFLIQPEIKASAWYVISNTLSRAATLLATPIFTRLLTPEQYGLYPLYVSYMGIFTVLATLELPGTITYSGLSVFGENRGSGFMLSALLCEAFLSVTLLSVYLPIRRYVNTITGMSTALTLILILQVFLNSLEGLYFSKKRFCGSYKWVTTVNCITGFLTPLMSIVLIKAGLTGGARIISQLAVSIALALYFAYRIVSEGRGLIRYKHFRYLFSLAIPMLPHYLSLSVSAGIDKIMISSILGASALGKYSAAFSVAFTVSLIGSGIQMALAPWIAKRVSKDGTESIREVLLASQTILAVITMLFLCIAPEIFGILTGEAYKEALGVIYPLGVGCLFSFSSSLCVSASVKLGRATGVTVATVQSMLYTVLLNYILISAVGYMGAAIASLLGALIRFLLNFRLLCRGEAKSTLNVKYYLRNLAFVTVFGIGLFAMRTVAVSRILIFVALLLILLSTLKKHKGLIFGNT